MRYGHFDDQNREYIITQPDTPLPWINYLGCESYFGLISNTAGGYSFYRDARLRRLTRYRYNNAPFDFGGRYLYLRDNESEQILVAVLAADAHQTRPIRMPPRHGLHHHRLHLQQDRGADHLFRAARRNAGNLEMQNHKPPQKTGQALALFQPRVLSLGRAGRQPPISSAISAPARWRSWMASFTTRPNIASAAIISRISPARKSSPATTRSATRSSALTAVGTTRRRWRAASRSTRSPAAGRRTARITSR